MKQFKNSLDSGAVDRALAESLLNNPEPNTTQLELRILQKTASLQQLHQAQGDSSRHRNSKASRGSRWLITSGLISSFATLAAVWFVVVGMAVPVADSQSENGSYLTISVAEPEQLVADSEFLNDSELELVEASNLVWDELILLEDELAFASL